METSQVAESGKGPMGGSHRKGGSCTRTPGALDKLVGYRLRQRRLAIGLSQMALADELGMTFQQIQKYERAANRVSATKLFEIAAILKTDLSYFFEDGPELKLDYGAPKHGQRGGFSETQEEYISYPAPLDFEMREAADAYVAITDGEVRQRLLVLMKAMRTR